MNKKTAGFFSEAECKDLLKYFEANAHKIEPFRDTYRLLDVETPLKNKLVDFITKEYGVKLNNLEIVKWPNESFMGNHYDGQRQKDNEYSCICYLNSDYEGGRTILENQFLENNTGDLIFFNSQKLLHAVEPVKGTRYTMISWYKKL
jgi:predicted 2-oxoglutarate/Fe(II)-dependent dioxygenase YbiX|tara:strand:+ start:194 stop:634 length:441 start_codon:yes stop_codon:yes gene_type:complete